MARQQAARRPVEDKRPPADGVQQSAPPTIQFEPELAVRAIVFHLADEGIAAQVDEQSARATLHRLRRVGIRPTVEQATWAEMTHAQRLEWLLDKTQTASRLIDDELSVLEPTAK